ncbi:MAG: PD40 domain-containing protein, partial [Anaerolineales bacterium]|nr:PD40 domain-containing protein [Anaerolineales bacterium]
MHSISRYLNVHIAYAPSFSSNGRFLSFLTNLTGISQVWQIDLNAATPENIPWSDQLTFAADRVMSAQFSPAEGDNRLFFTHDVGGNENAQMFLYDADSGAEIALSAGYEQAMHIPGEWSPDGRFLLFAANRRHPGQFDLYRQPLDGGAPELLWQHEAPGYLYHQHLSPDGKRVIMLRIAKSSAHDLLELNLESGEVRQLNPSAEEARFVDVTYSKDGRSLYVLTDLRSDFLHIAQLDLATLTWETLVTPNWDVELMALSPNGRFLAYSINEDGQSKLELIDMALGMARRAPLPDGAPSLVGWYDEALCFSPDSTRLAFSYTSATRTSDVYVWHVDPTDDALYPVTRMAHGGIPPAQFVTAELVHFPTFDQRQIPAWLYRPETAVAAKRPVVIIVHGGPESQYRPYFNFLAQYLVHNGYVVLAPNVRGSTGYGRAYGHLD